MKLTVEISEALAEDILKAEDVCYDGEGIGPDSLQWYTFIEALMAHYPMLAERYKYLRGARIKPDA